MHKIIVVSGLLLLAANAFAASITYSGSLVPNDLVHSGRLNRTGTSSACALDKSCPGTVDGLSRHFHKFSFNNTSAGVLCLRIYVNYGTQALITVYSPTFDPANLCANYLGDYGKSSSTGQWFEVRVQPHSDFIVVVTETDPDLGGYYSFYFSDATNIAENNVPCAPGDYNRQSLAECNGADPIVRNTTTGANAAVFNTTLMTLPTIDPAFTLGAVGFFAPPSSKGQDIVWRNNTTGENVLWIMDRSILVASIPLRPIGNPNIRMVGSGDFNGDGFPDLLFRNSDTGGNAVWLMTAWTLNQIVDLQGVGDPNWQIAGVGDFNGDHKPDIVWHNSATGQVAVWLMNGTSLLSVVDLPGVTNTEWTIGGVADVNNDGSCDILWHNTANGTKTTWLMNGTNIQSMSSINVSAQTDLVVAGPK